MSPNRCTRVPQACAWRTPDVQTLHEQEESFCCVKLQDFRVCYLSFVDLVLTDRVMTIEPLKAHKKQVSRDCIAYPGDIVWSDYKPFPLANVGIIMHLSRKKSKYNS